MLKISEQGTMLTTKSGFTHSLRGTSIDLEEYLRFALKNNVKLKRILLELVS